MLKAGGLGKKGGGEGKEGLSEGRLKAERGRQRLEEERECMGAQRTEDGKSLADQQPDQAKTIPISTPQGTCTHFPTSTTTSPHFRFPTPICLASLAIVFLALSSIIDISTLCIHLSTMYLSLFLARNIHSFYKSSIFSFPRKKTLLLSLFHSAAIHEFLILLRASLWLKTKMADFHEVSNLFNRKLGLSE